MARFELHHGDCLEVLKTMPDNSVDAVVCDPPYGLSFMGRKWDYDVPEVAVWAECLRVLKPGGHLLAFAGTRTQHRMAVRIEDAGFEIRDMIAWVYGSGFPKSLDVSKAIDKAAGAERVAYGVRTYADGHVQRSSPDKLRPPIGTFERTQDGRFVTAPATEAAKRWQGWGTALKPAMEPITVARKPLVGTVAENVLTHGTGTLNIDGCRVQTDDELNGGAYSGHERERAERTSTDTAPGAVPLSRLNRGVGEYVQPTGRWPANLIHDGSDEVVGLLGDAARFFYCAKASKRDRGADNKHPTVKPTDLMRYLCRLVTPPGGVVLDPFAGSGSTGKAVVLEGFRFVGIEREAEYVDIARARMAVA